MVILAAAMLLAFASPEKKIDKLVSKVWKDKEVDLIAMEIPDTLTGTITSLNEVRYEGKIIGYACYTSAFGCKIGGCAAPSNPNAQAFETFDYIVIYDADLNVKKVDIANYSGQYGYEICRPKWLTQFIGKNSGFELEGDIDGISGATVSAQYLIDDLNEMGQRMKDMDLTSLTASSK